MFDVYSVVQGVDKFLPVDVYVQGCPPRPDSFIEGILLLQNAVGSERRPLSWVIGPQGVERAPLPSMRDIKRAERQKVGVLPSPDAI
jgi:NADH-quinone oxidoreductase subunit B